MRVMSIVALPFAYSTFYTYMMVTALIVVAIAQIPPIRRTQASPKCLLTYPVYLLNRFDSMCDLTAS